MNKRIASIVLGTTLALGLAGSASAVRFVNSYQCGHATIFNATERWGIRIYPYNPGEFPTRHIVFPGSGDITIRLAPGTYSYQFHAPNGNARRSGSFTVGC
jgi:hypothetical protein